MSFPKLNMDTGFDEDDTPLTIRKKKKQERDQRDRAALKRGASHGGHGHSHGGGEDHGHSHGGQQEQQPLTLEMACAEGALSQVVMLWAQGLSMTQADANGFPPLMWAALKNQCHVARFLLEQGANPNQAASDGQTALMWAATECNLEVAKLLVENGADIHQTDQHGYTAACIAVQNSHLSFVHLLHTLKGLNPEEKDNDGHHLTTWACYKGDVHILQYLHEVLGVPLNGVDKMHRNALHWAGREGHTDCAIYLMGHGVSSTPTDDEGKTPYEWAKDRHHEFCAAAIKANEGTARNHCIGSLALLMSSRTHLFNCCAMIAYFIVHYLWSHWMIPVWCHFPISIYFGKNMWYTFIRKTPLQNSVAETTIMEDLGAPKTLMGAMRGPIQLRRREVANLFAVAAFISVQYMAATTTGVPVPSVFLPCVLGMIVLGALAKSNSFKNVIEPAQVKDDPSLPLIAEGNFTAATQERIYDQHRHIRVPLRAFYCYEVDRVVKRYDSYSVMLDCPIANNNHRSFFAVLICFFILETSLFYSAFDHMTTKHCPADWTLTSSVMRTSWNMAFSNLPCAVKLNDDTWKEWFLPKPDNMAGAWLLSYALPFSGVLLAIIIRQLAAIAHGVTRAELADPFAPNVNGEMESIARGNTYIFSDAGKLGNFIMWLMGKAGQRWESMQALPAKASA